MDHLMVIPPSRLQGPSFDDNDCPIGFALCLVLRFCRVCLLLISESWRRLSSHARCKRGGMDSAGSLYLRLIF